LPNKIQSLSSKWPWLDNRMHHSSRNQLNITKFLTFVAFFVISETLSEEALKSLVEEHKFQMEEVVPYDFLVAHLGEFKEKRMVVGSKETTY
jgi:hypothetical protein